MVLRDIDLGMTTEELLKRVFAGMQPFNALTVRNRNK
jgi:hypothetical protein